MRCSLLDYISTLVVVGGSGGGGMCHSGGVVGHWSAGRGEGGFNCIVVVSLGLHVSVPQAQKVKSFASLCILKNAIMSQLMFTGYATVQKHCSLGMQQFRNISRVKLGS
jgi:hypothetical protein